MVPDSDLQLQVTIKALAEAVAPAIAPGERVAQEQLQLAIATLGLLRRQLPMTRRFLRALAGDALASAERLAEAIPAEALAAPRAALAAALEDPAIENHEIEAARATLVEATAALIAELAPEHRAAARTIVLAAEARPIERQRAWFVGSGFEPHADALPAIEALLG